MARYIHLLRDMIGSANTQASDGRRFARAVPEPYAAILPERLIAAWAVIAGAAHAVRWPEVGELEDALDKPKGWR